MVKVLVNKYGLFEDRWLIKTTKAFSLLFNNREIGLKENSKQGF